jgi:hypothetical protein
MNCLNPDDRNSQLLTIDMHILTIYSEGGCEISVPFSSYSIELDWIACLLFISSALHSYMRQLYCSRSSIVHNHLARR